MTRKGFIDGRSLRLPTVTVRPGKPNKAASSFASGIIREPLAGVDAPCPVAPTTRMWVQSPRAVIDNLVIGHEAPAAAFAHTRSINVPGICVAVGDMVAALRRVAGDAVADRVKWQFDPAIDRIVVDLAGEFRAAPRARAGHAGRRGFREHRPRLHRRRHAAALRPRRRVSRPRGAAGSSILRPTPRPAARRTRAAAGTCYRSSSPAILSSSGSRSPPCRWPV